MQINEAIKLFSQCVNNQQSNALYNGVSIRFQITQTPKDIVQEYCTVLNLTFLHHDNNESEVFLSNDINSSPCIIFFDEDDYSKQGENFFEIFDSLHLVMLLSEKGLIEKMPFEAFDKDKALFFNLYNFYLVFNFLKIQDHFMSFLSEAEHRFVLFTTEVGPFHIEYDLNDTEVKKMDDVSLIFVRLKEQFNKVDFVQFFKSAIINTLHTIPEQNRFFELVKSMQLILNVAERDHFIYIRNFDFDKIKSKFKEERNKYFESLDKNIDSIRSQVVSIPLTFAVSIFASYQVKERPAIMILVFLGYLLYTVIAWMLLNVTQFNKENIKTDTNSEEKKIKDTYNLLHSEFDSDFRRIDRKIGKIESLINVFRGVLAGLLLCFFFFSLYQMFWSNNAPPEHPIKVQIVK